MKNDFVKIHRGYTPPHLISLGGGEWSAPLKPPSNNAHSAFFQFFPHHLV